MAVKTYYFKNAVPTGATLHRSLQDGGTAPTAATTTTGWNPGTNAAGQSCLQNGGTEVARNSTTPPWGTTLQPSTSPSQTLGDCWRSENTLSGQFANTNWTFAFGVRSVTAAYTGRFRLAVRVWRSTNANGSGATELTSGRVTSAITAANLSTTADTTVSITWTPGATKSLSNEYLFVQVGIEITTAGGGTTQDVDFRVASTYTVTTPNFTQIATGNMAATESGLDTFASTGDVFVKGTMAATETGNDTFAASGDVFIKGTMASTESGSDTFAASGVVTNAGVTGTMSATETGKDTFSASGKVLIKGSLAATETGSDTFASSGKVIVKGTMAATEVGIDTFSATGVITTSAIAGTMAATESGSDVFAATGQVITPVVFVTTKGGIPKAKTHIKKSEHEDIAAIVKREFDILDGTYQPEAVEQVKQAIMPKIQQIQQIDYTEYAIALAQVNELLLQAKIQVAEYQAELDDEEALLMLL